MSSFFRLGLRFGVCLGFWLAGCGRIDTGPETGPPAGCDIKRPDLFVSDVWPKYFQQGSLTSQTCGKSDCHDASTGHGFFRLQSLAGVPTPAPTDPISIWPTAWAANLRAVQTNVSCSNPCQSVLLVVPSGQGQPHPPGNIVTDNTGACALFTMWLK